MTENHQYEACLIPVDVYKASSDAVKDNYEELQKKAIQPMAVADLTGWYFEPKTGFIGSTEPSSYNRIVSSKGLVIKVKLKTGSELVCYLINNYDTLGTLNWKNQNTCP